MLFVNGLPLGVIELKNPADEDATIWTAWQQLQTYKAELPTLFSMNEALMVSDGNEARVGTLTSGREWFKPWRTVTGEMLADPHMTELQVMLEGVFEPGRFLALVRDSIVFDDDGSGALVKKMAGYHQFHAVRVAVNETLRAAKLQRAEARIAEEGEGRYESGRKPGGAPGDCRIGVVWHTQGSGKSLTMAFYAGAVVREPAMENPTVVVLTDPVAGRSYLGLRHAQEVRLGVLVLEDDEYVGLRAVVVGGPVRGVVAQVWRDSGGHGDGAHRPTLPLWEEGPYALAPSQDAEGVGLSGAHPAVKAEVVRRPAWRVELDQMPGS